MVGAEVVETTERALAAGAPLVQVRAKDVTDRARYVCADQLSRACVASGALCLVNDRVDVALAVAAAGVHVGADDLPVALARRLLGDGALVGATCRDAEAARRAVDEGASYLGVGPAFSTTTKAGLPPPLGLGGIEAVASAVEVPVVAIAGVTAERVPRLLDAGAWGVAVVAAVFEADDPSAATAELLELLGEGAGARRPPGRAP
ncbi:MAG: thiamine phosphate synthase [Acidimicrobiia bacterium]|nr:thiamine phosphate synthase [Acidimicrobiia bacterium]